MANGVRGLAAHRHSHTALRIHQHCNRRFGHFARTVLRGLGKGESYGDTVVTFPERADNATLDVAAEILSLPAAGLLLRDIILCGNQVATMQCWSSSIVTVQL
jgi:hypothetical protein